MAYVVTYTKRSIGVVVISEQLVSNLEDARGVAEVMLENPDIVDQNLVYGNDAVEIESVNRQE